jgi:hypothetical protein
MPNNRTAQLRHAATTVVNGLIMSRKADIQMSATEPLINAVEDSLAEALIIEDGIVLEAERRLASAGISVAGPEMLAARAHDVAREYGVEIGHAAQARRIAELFARDENVEELYVDDDELQAIILEPLTRTLPARDFSPHAETRECPNCGTETTAVELLFVDGERRECCPECHDAVIGITRQCPSCNNWFTDLIDGECANCRVKKGLPVAQPGEFVCYITGKIYPEKDRSEIGYIGAPLSQAAALILAHEGDYPLLKWAWEKGYRFCAQCEQFVPERELPKSPEDFMDLHRCGKVCLRRNRG